MATEQKVARIAKKYLSESNPDVNKPSVLRTVSQKPLLTFSSDAFGLNILQPLDDEF